MQGSHTVTLDLEASSLTEDGYPIEVAFVLGIGPNITAQFATLIRPRSSWRAQRGWDKRSQAVHGIAYNELADGMDADAVCDILSRSLADRSVYVDGGSYDTFWLEKLYDGRPMSFVLNHLSGIQPRDFIALKRASVPAHRALADARWLWAAVTRLNMPPHG
jgi:hypothetical protein